MTPMNWNGASTPPRAHEANGPRPRTVAVVAALLFLVIYVAFFPATYSIEDESNIISLATALGHGTVFLDRAGIDSGRDLPVLGHRISKYSPFHAALLTPAIATAWRLAFLVTAGFVLLGAWIIVRMLEREGLSSDWVLLYFVNPGLLYYSRTLLSMVPASVMALFGVSLLFRSRPRPVAGALALGAAALLHIWLAPVALVIAGCWWVERSRTSLRGAAALVTGAAPAVLLMGLYNGVTTGNPLVNSYWLIGHQQNFAGDQLAGFVVYYSMALLFVPPGGWMAMTRRWAGSAAVPLAIVAVLTLASFYYYRDGMNFGVAGWVPGLRFLLPASLLAVVPAAHWWNDAVLPMNPNKRLRWLAPVWGTALFGLGFAVLSVGHQDYLNAQRDAQRFVATEIPAGARIVGGPGTFKLFAPVVGRWSVELVEEGESRLAVQRRDCYVVWITSSEEQVDPGWFRDRASRATTVNSWIWRRKIVIGRPAAPEPPGSGSLSRPAGGGDRPAGPARSGRSAGPLGRVEAS
jgi:hypothetical protein